MKLLLDTHALLWWLADDDLLGRDARQAIERPDTQILVSVVSLWEIVVKLRVGKLQADVGEVWTAILAAGFAMLDISLAHLLELSALPLHHRDPFDHLLIAQAKVEDAVFLSDDRHVPRYGIRYMTCADPANSFPDIP